MTLSGLCPKGIKDANSTDWHASSMIKYEYQNPI